MNTVNNNGVTHTTVQGKISVDGISHNEIKGRMQAQLRQVFTTTSLYPSKRISNSMADNLFDVAEFSFESKSYESEENRVTWLDVPDNTTPEQVLAKLAALGDKARIYRVLSNKPILADNQEYGIENGDQTIEDYANRQVVRYPEEHADYPGQLILVNGMPQYRTVHFSTNNLQDVDTRATKFDANSFYASPEILEEMEALAKADTVTHD